MMLNDVPGAFFFFTSNKLVQPPGPAPYCKAATAWEERQPVPISGSINSITLTQDWGVSRSIGVM